MHTGEVTKSLWSGVLTRTGKKEREEAVARGCEAYQINFWGSEHQAGDF